MSFVERALAFSCDGARLIAIVSLPQQPLRRGVLVVVGGPQYRAGSLCPLCHGKRLKREALSVTFAGLDIGALSQLPLDQLAGLLQPAAEGRLADIASQSKPLARAAARKATAARVASGGAAHAAAPDVRRTSNVSEEKVMAAQRLAHNLLGRVATLTQLAWAICRWSAAPPRCRPASCSDCVWRRSWARIFLA